MGVNAGPRDGEQPSIESRATRSALRGSCASSARGSGLRAGEGPSPELSSTGGITRGARRVRPWGGPAKEVAMPAKPSHLLGIVAGGLLPIAAPGCSSTTVTESRTSWYTTCGDPVCRGYQKPAGVQACTSEKPGGACATEGARCDPLDSCNRLLLCSASDPKLQGCPISTVAVKRDVHYLDDEARDRYARRPLAAKLAGHRNPVA